MQLETALRDFEDLMARAVIPFLVLDHTAKDIFDMGPLSGDHISVGIQSEHLDRFVKDVFGHYADGVKPTAYGLEYKVDEVPVRIKVYQQEETFKYPDLRFYAGGQYALPNPFMKYWEQRNKKEVV